MEIYIPYVLGSGAFAFASKITYNYFTYTKNTTNTNKLIKETNIDDLKNEVEFNLIDNNLEEKEVNSDTKYKKNIGVTISQKINAIKKICIEECGFNNFSNDKKTRQRIIRYAKEYEKIGHDRFIDCHRKKKNKNKLFKDKTF